MVLNHNDLAKRNELFDNDEAESNEKDQKTRLFFIRIIKMIKIKQKSINTFEVVKDQFDLRLNIKTEVEEIK